VVVFWFQFDRTFEVAPENRDRKVQLIGRTLKYLYSSTKRQVQAVDLTKGFSRALLALRRRSGGADTATLAEREGLAGRDLRVSC
jgi:hypothetical protein